MFLNDIKSRGICLRKMCRGCGISATCVYNAIRRGGFMPEVAKKLREYLPSDIVVPEFSCDQRLKDSWQTHPNPFIRWLFREKKLPVSFCRETGINSFRFKNWYYKGYSLTDQEKRIIHDYTKGEITVDMLGEHDATVGAKMRGSMKGAINEKTN